MTKVLLCDYGYYNLSPKAYKMIAQELGKECYFFDDETYQEISEQTLIRGGWFATFSKEVSGDYFELLPDFNDDRSNPILIKIVETLKQEAFESDIDDIRIAEIPDGIDWVIESNDETMYEWVAERHKTWSGEKL